MDALEAIEAIARGEDTQHQFKRLFNNEKQAAAEMAAFANSEGGFIFLGVEDNGTITGLTPDEIRRQNMLISNAASQMIHDPINPRTQNLTVSGSLTLMVVSVPEGNNKPYLDNDGVVWLKVGSDKRRVTAKEELRRLFQESDLLQADEIPVRGCDAGQLEAVVFSRYYTTRYHEEPPTQPSPFFNTLLENLNLGRAGELNLTGLLLFGSNPQRFKPTLIVKAVRFVGAQETGTEYRVSEDFGGRLVEQFRGALGFIGRNLPSEQGGQSFNSQGIKRVPAAVLEELLVNALLHRNYLLNAPIRLLFFDNRIEIVSPGALPNHLTVEKIRLGNSSIRNAALVSFAANGVLPYRGIGTGVRRALELYPGVEFKNDPSGQLFRAIIPLPPGTFS